MCAPVNEMSAQNYRGSKHHEKDLLILKNTTPCEVIVPGLADP
jgi:hypothetical protein